MQDTKVKKYNKGITLVALVITVIVLLILAGVGISALTGEDGLIEKAKQAAEEYEQASQEEADTVNGLLNIIGGENTPPQEGITAADINQNPSLYYGEEVEYTSQNGAPVGWKIFYADEENIYLIADDYVPNTYAPNAANGTAIDKTGTYNIDFQTIVDNSAYTGTADIRTEDERVTKWISHINSYTSEYENMKATAYLLDTSIWSGYKDSNNKAEYVIGGPTLELFIASYNDTHETDINYEVTSEVGYKVKWSTDTSFNYYIEGLDTSESLYVIADDTNAWGYWLASPSARSNGYFVFRVFFNGRVDDSDYSSSYYGFRPLICLKSEIQLIEQESGKYAIN